MIWGKTQLKNPQLWYQNESARPSMGVLAVYSI